MSINVFFIILAICRINFLGDPVGAERWPRALDETLDERNDAEIFQAVVESMRQWELHKKISHRAKRDTSRVCYEDVGCFEDTGPFSYLEMLPSPPKDVGTRFFVYGSRKARSVPMEVAADDINEKANNAIDPELPTKVIVHGFGSGCDHIWVYEMRSALISVHDCNIVCVDWSPGSVLPNYVRAAANTRLVGRQLAKLIKGLNVSLDKVHFIGFSLGAHVAGFAGAELGNVSRITGLDPAGPLFESQDPRARLDETDANFVDVIHSNGEQLILGGLGSWQPMGDVDFYPNGGRMQIGCSNLFVGAVSDIIWSGSIEGRSLCNHRRAYKLFTDSISPKCRFPAFPCEKGYDGLLQGDCFPCGQDRPCGDMGYYSDSSNARGQLYLVTREEEPFCAHQYQIKVYNSRSERPTRSYGKLQVTLVGAGGFNETFTMTKKDDEELVVGAILHKIVVPHPVVINLEAIEVKYTAYSGWISSGLVSWSIDKVSIFDSFGKSLSICRKGLILESGHPVHFPLYSGECNIPEESAISSGDSTSNITTSSSNAVKDSEDSEKSNAVTKTTGIGPFTKDQNFQSNFDRKDTYTVDLPIDRTSSSKNIGPFTKDQNLRIFEKTLPNPPEEPKQTIWTFIDLNETGNSLDNLETESGRGFSSLAYIPTASKTSNYPQNTVPPPQNTKFHSEIQEPVLQVKKKETGRSMRLPEITEPILRPRTTRQNQEANSEDLDERQVSGEKERDEFTGFTVQFLPERLAGILAQAERYARQTLLPLISQYTPSFINNSRRERLKYFPPLSEISEDDDKINKPMEVTSKDVGNNSPAREGESRVSEDISGDKGEDWIPISLSGPQSNGDEKNDSSFRSSDNSNGKWINREGKELITGQRNENGDSKRESAFENIPSKNSGGVGDGDNNRQINDNNNDWVPIIDKVKIQSSILDSPNVVNFSSVESVNSDKEKDGRKFIPLVDLQRPNANLASKGNEDSTEVISTTEEILSHIHKVEEDKGEMRSGFRSLAMKSLAFPYAYERKTDPRTRYIPLVPEEDMGRKMSIHEREER
ncbi:uncharacterized protein LOC107040644 [Diachasma alloeum]|uniref:uncharacterized protein LOC107040644 n=1 Tax=Diachasma alloeum TaxID=454923 RepID=UPI0007381596|nr:uncharacterized protein LOC107040644 [Diachasma alloeum]